MPTTATVEVYFYRGPFHGRTLNVPEHVAAMGIVVESPRPFGSDYSSDLDAPVTAIGQDRTVYHYLRRDRVDTGARIFVPLTTKAQATR